MSSPAEPAATPPVPLDAALLRAWPMPVRHGGDKFTRGTAVVVGGSPRTPGAVRLAGEAGLRMGAGRLQIATASEAALTLGVAVPEALVVPLEADDDGGLRWTDTTQLATMLREADAVLIGPGMLNETCGELVAGVLRCISDEAIVVLDARALCGLAETPDELIPRGRLVLTPNRQELRTLAGNEAEPQGDTEDATLASSVAQRYGAVISCFGRVTSSDRSWTVGAGSPGLGTSGSGDVLAGLVVGAAARCGNAAQATCWATVAHNESAASLERRYGRLSFLARDLVAETAFVMGTIESPCRAQLP
jgi:ADP-dependent NAD(P)H-hydrate dehydratase